MGVWDIVYKFGNWLFKLSPDYKEYLLIKEENKKLINENNKLKKELDISKDLIFENGLYWNKSGDKGPFCPVCWDDKKRKIHLRGSDEKGWDCYCCNFYLNLSEEKQSEIDDNGWI